MKGSPVRAGVGSYDLQGFSAVADPVDVSARTRRRGLDAPLLSVAEADAAVA
jgi:hypothetical protein